MARWMVALFERGSLARALMAVAPCRRSRRVCWPPRRGLRVMVSLSAVAVVVPGVVHRCVGGAANAEAGGGAGEFR